MLYNLVGEHAARVAESRALLNSQAAQQQSDGDFEKLLLELCEGILLHDK